MLASLIDFKSSAGREIEVMLEDAGARDIARADALRTLRCAVFWSDVRKMTKILRPLADCVAIAETASSNIGEAMKAILLFAKALFASDWDDEFTMSGITTFLAYFNSKRLGHNLNLLLTAYHLDRRNKMDFITKSGSEKVLLTLTRLAQTLGYSKGQIENDLVDDFKNYTEQRGQLGSLSSDDQSPEEWWDAIAGCPTIKRIALRVVRLKASSANIERTFSAMKYIQGPNRHNFSLKTLKDMARIRTSDTTETLGDEDFDLLEPDEPQAEVQSQRRPRPSLYSRLKARLMSPSSRSHDRADLDLTLDSEGASSDSGSERPKKIRVSSSHLFGSLTSEEKSHYKQFFKLVDFSLINDYHTEPDLLDDQEPARELEKRIIRKFRSGRRG